jgi:sulfate permease, SulP family
MGYASRLRNLLFAARRVATRSTALGDLEGYSVRMLRDDAGAALTVAIVALPQSMAYAMIAGLDPVYGLYTAMVTAVLGSFFGNSRHLITGPTNAIALMVGATMKNHLGVEGTYGMVFLLSLLVGSIQVALGLLRVGKVVNFVSRSVIVGFTAGAGVIIGLGQLNELLGIGLARGYLPLHAKVWGCIVDIGSTNPYALGIGLFSAAVVIVSRKVNRAIPGALLGLVLSAALVAAFGLEARGVKTVGAMSNHLPPFSLPTLSFQAVSHFSGGALAIALVGLVEAAAISRSIATSSGQRLGSSREFLGQGLANMAGAFFSCFPASGSFTRSAINYSAQARTRIAGVLSGVFLAVILVFFAPYAHFVARASLAAVIILVAYDMVDQHAVGRIMRASRHDLAVMLITMGATVIMPDLERAILTGVAVSVIVHAWNTGEIRVKLLQPSPHGFTEIDVHAGGCVPAVVVPIIHIEGDLYFGSSNDLEDKLTLVADSARASVCILRLKRVNVIDVSALEVVETFVDRMLARRGTVMLCGVSPVLRRYLDKIGLTARVGADNVFMAADEVYASSTQAYHRAMEIVKALPAAGAGTRSPREG